MKKLLHITIGALMVISLAACSPTTDKPAKTGDQGSQPQTQEKEVVEKLPDANAPVLELFSVYYPNEDNTGLKQTVDGVEVLDADSLVDQLVAYGVLAKGTISIDFTTEGESGAAVLGPGEATEITVISSAVLELSEFPVENRELLITAVVNTFTDSMNIETLTISVDDEVIAADMAFTESYSKLK